MKPRGCYRAAVASPDVIVVGAGHNGLICAAYLARAGLRVQVLERRDIPGGCTATEEMAPGVWVNRCQCDHLFLYTTPIPAELELQRYGLENIEADPCHWAPSRDGQGLVFWKDVGRTADAIGQRSAKDARAYLRFVRRWSEIFKWLQPILLGSPTPGAAGRRMLRQPGRTVAGLRNLPTLLRAQSASVRDVLDATFEDVELKGVLAFFSAALAGLPPSAPRSAMFCFAIVLHHLAGVRRPRGGSGGLVRALIAAIEAHGGSVRTGAAVERIRVEAGTVRGVLIQNGEEIAARSVVAACDPQTTFLRLLDSTTVPTSVRNGIRRLQVANGFALKVDYKIDRLPQWQPHPMTTHEELLRATTYVSPSINYLEAAYADYAQRRNSRRPALIVSTPTAADPSLVSDGAHLLTVETRYAPYELEPGQSWQEVGERESQRLFEMLEPYAPNLKGAKHLPIVQSPVDLERDLGLPRGNMVHIDASPSQSLARRPLPGLANYRSPIRGLYLTGAGTHPGGGVWGAPGHNAAHEILRDLGA
ncbi:MAG: phytoene desaturase family protein [Phycisphaerae bacterium]